MKTENNKIIAEFIGWEINNELWINDKKVFVQYTDQSLKFNSDWNRLMEVVEKIEKLKYFIQIDSIGVVISKEKKIITVSDNRSKIEAVYNACLEFIKYYNVQEFSAKKI